MARLGVQLASILVQVLTILHLVMISRHTGEANETVRGLSAVLLQENDESVTFSPG